MFILCLARVSPIIHACYELTKFLQLPLNLFLNLNKVSENTTVTKSGNQFTYEYFSVFLT